MHSVVVVIPIYREELKLSETASLNQVNTVLGHYDICFMAPEKMRKWLTNKKMRAEYWPDKCFENVRAYSRLLLTTEFYNRFDNYEYMLLYQLDAFVFSNDLEKFCDKGYDYIGAPMPHWTGWKHNKVGNGGLSLRKIASCKMVTSQKDTIYKNSNLGSAFDKDEDKFFAYCGYDINIKFLVPDTKTALSFSVEFDVMRVYSKLSDSNLPFGCHAWSKAHYWRIWEPFLKSRIKNWNEVVSKELQRLGTVEYTELRRKDLINYLCKRLLREDKILMYEHTIDEILPASNEYILWGGGESGSVVKQILMKFRRKIECYIDSNESIKEVDGIKALRPENIRFTERKYKIIVSVKKYKYSEEITCILQKYGLKNRVDFLLYMDLVEYIVREYYKKSVGGWCKMC